MSKKILFLLFIFVTAIGFANNKVIKIATAGYPMDQIAKIAAEDLKKQGYDVKLTLLTDYVTANIGLNAGDFDANFHQHEPFMQVFNRKNNGKLVKIKGIYDVYVGFYSKKYKSKSQLPKGARTAIPNDPTNQDRALRILAREGLIDLKPKNGLYTLSDVINVKKNLKFISVPIPSLVQAYQEADLAFNWPSHMLKIGVSVKNALFTEKGSAGKYAVSLVARQDNRNSKKIQDLTRAMTSEKVRKFLKEKYFNEGFPVF
ncbi:methionine-binding protein [Leptotrichia sp. OH3620_COT-345]|uniref:MetQ/NlpA family ABC transporter substrate-binding protein n=1 Tax=Leptotrichia sp. OH3620_COT-345 TaxID=2491048 RepID=UPI000F653A4B|nr:MetQ/NlpA family ABC transporter substrate-binding protein [Leptotrichia sp. OH3620_COT-345]RRD40709.1 methionine-binding protein [Leptotrichia sp. OH3620_COT-345]